MTTFYRYRKSIIFALFLPLLTMLCHGESFARGQDSDDAFVSNIFWKVEGNYITITYDLNGSLSQQYDVSIIMLRENVSSFYLVPQSVEGDIGKGYFAGQGRKIRWKYRDDYPPGFQGEGYYFEIRVKNVSGDKTWLYYALGAAAVAGGVVAFLVSSKQAEEQPPGLPLPPPRP